MRRQSPVVFKIPVGEGGEDDLREEVNKLLMDSSLTDESHKETLVNMLRRCRKAFAAPGEPLGRTDKVLHDIKVGDNPAFKIPYRR